MVQVSRWLLWATSPLHNFSCNYDRFTKWTASASRYWVFKDTKENCYMMINLLAWIQLNIFQRELIQILPLFSYSLRIPHDHTKTKIFWGNFQIFPNRVLISVSIFTYWYLYLRYGIVYCIIALHCRLTMRRWVCLLLFLMVDVKWCFKKLSLYKFMCVSVCVLGHKF